MACGHLRYAPVQDLARELAPWTHIFLGHASFGRVA